MLQTIRRRVPEQVQNSRDTKSDDSCTFSAQKPIPGHGPDESRTSPVRSPAEPGRVPYGARQRSGRSPDESEAPKVKTVARFQDMSRILTYPTEYVTES